MKFYHGKLNLSKQMRPLHLRQNEQINLGLLSLTYKNRQPEQSYMFPLSPVKQSYLFWCTLTEAVLFLPGYSNGSSFNRYNHKCSIPILYDSKMKTCLRTCWSSLWFSFRKTTYLHSVILRLHSSSLKTSLTMIWWVKMQNLIQTGCVEQVHGAGVTGCNLTLDLTLKNI